MADRRCIFCHRVHGIAETCGQAKPRPPVKRHAVSHTDDVANKPTPAGDMANNMANATSPVVSHTYRYRDPEKRKAYMAKLMRDRRAAGKP